jgi:uncharacterized damage-inducible protein DinB
MTASVLEKIFEHNNWANEQILHACSALTDEQLDATPVSATKGTIRETLQHLVRSQAGYLSLLTLPVDQRHRIPAASISELEDAARLSGGGLLALARDEANRLPKTRLQTTDGFYVEPWIVMIQIINHATEHREQIKSMLSALGITPPEIDGWTYAEVTRAVQPVSQG